MVLVVLAGVVWIAIRTALAPPAWYAPPDVTDPAVGALGERVEYRLVEELQRVRPPTERWTLRLTDEQVNAWLVSRLPGWWRTESGEDWPASVGVPQVRSEPDRLILAIAADLPALRAGASAEVRAEPRPRPEAGEGDAGGGGSPAADGPPPIGLARLGVRLGDIRLGRSSTPPTVLTERLLEATGAEGADADRLRAAITDPAGWLDELIESALAAEVGASGREGSSAGLPFRLADGRPVRLVAVGFEHGAITVSFEGRGD